MRLVQQLGRSVSRFRWAYKLRQFRNWPNYPLSESLRFVLMDPDINTFTYELSNGPELCKALARVSDRPEREVLDFGDELDNDQELRSRLFRQTRFKLQSKNHPPLGRHLLSYCAVRIVKPELVVESGVKHGLGTVVILRALERNAAEGHSGSLLSIDPDPASGWMARPGDHANWQLIHDVSERALPSALGGRKVGVIISDSDPAPSVTQWEFDSATQSAADELILMANHHWNDIARRTAQSLPARVETLWETPQGHPYPGRGVDVVYVRAKR